MRLTNNQILTFAIICAMGWAFTTGLSSAALSEMFAISKQLKQENRTLKAENANLNIEVKGLTRLMRLKDEQNICHYSHEVVRHDFRVINKR